MIRDTGPKNQTAAEAIKVIHDAQQHGGSVSVSKDGTLNRVKSSANTFNKFLFFIKDKLGFESKDQIRERKAVIVEVVSKMHKEIHQASSHIDNVGNLLKTHIHDLNEFKNDGQVRQLQDQWHILKNTVAAAENGSEKSQELLKPISKITITDGASNPKNIPERIKESEPISTNLTANPQIAEANLCLPTSIPKITKAGEVVKGTLTISPEAQLSLFNEWSEWDTHDNDLGKTSGDPFIGLSKAFQKDADRMTYVFESKGLAVECDRDKQTVAIGFKQISGKNPMRQLILSHLLGQEAIKRMLEKIQFANPNSDGMSVMFFGTNTPGEAKSRIHMTANENGDVEIDYLYLSKSQNIGNSEMTAEINRSKKFDGQLNRENAATCMTMKILLSNADLNRGEMRFTIIEPLKLDVQVELPIILDDQ
jgi:hypothetical protein